MKAEVLVVELQSVGNLVRADISRKSFLYSSSRYHIYSLFDVSNGFSPNPFNFFIISSFAR